MKVCQLHKKLVILGFPRFIGWFPSIFGGFPNFFGAFVGPIVLISNWKIPLNYGNEPKTYRIRSKNPGNAPKNRRNWPINRGKPCKKNSIVCTTSSKFDQSSIFDIVLNWNTVAACTPRQSFTSKQRICKEINALLRAAIGTLMPIYYFEHNEEFAGEEWLMTNTYMPCFGQLLMQCWSSNMMIIEWRDDWSINIWECCQQAKCTFYPVRIFSNAC